MVNSSLWKTHCRATEQHLSFGITQCYLPADAGETLDLSQASRY